MRKSILLMTAIVISTAIAFVACMDTTAEKSDAKTNIQSNDAATIAARIKQGEYLVSITGCDDCHSPKRMGTQGQEIIPELRLSGYSSTRPIMKPDSNVVK